MNKPVEMFHIISSYPSDTGIVQTHDLNVAFTGVIAKLLEPGTCRNWSPSAVTMER
jgi:hypothetical protein